MYNKINFVPGQRLMASDLNHVQDGIAILHDAFEVGDSANIAQCGYITVDKNGQPATTIGAIASGKGSVAFGGQRYDKINSAIEEEPPTTVSGEQSFGAGGGVLVEGAWSAGFGKDVHLYQRGAFAAGGGNIVGVTKEDWDANKYPKEESQATAAYDVAYINAAAFGESNKVYCRGGFAVGARNVITNLWAAGIGDRNEVSGPNAVGLGYDNTVSGHSAIGTGYGTTAAGDYAFTHGIYTVADADYAYAGGYYAESHGLGARSVGNKTIANGNYSYAGGVGCVTDAKATGAFLHGNGLKTSLVYGAAFGQYNVGGKLFEVGMGLNDTKRKSPFFVSNNGDVFIYRTGTKDADGNWIRKPRSYSLSKVLNSINAFDTVDSWGPGQYIEYDF